MKIRGSSDGLIMKLRGEKSFLFAAFHPIFPQRQACAKELFCSELFWAPIVGRDENWRNQNKNANEMKSSLWASELWFDVSELRRKFEKVARV